MPQDDECMYKGKQKFTKDQMVFMAEAALLASLEQVESGMPHLIDWDRRLTLAGQTKPKQLTQFEQGAVKTAGMTLSIMSAQLHDAPLGVADALKMAGKFDQKVAEFVKACWAEQGAVVRQRMKSMGSRPFSPDKVLPEYPDCRKAAQKFVERLTGDSTTGD